MDFFNCASRAAGQHFANFAEAEVDNLLPRARHEIVGRADDQLQILASAGFQAAGFRSQCSKYKSDLLKIHCVV